MYNVILRCFRLAIVAAEKQCVTYSECAFVALVIQDAMRMRHIAACGLSDYNIFPHYLINGTIFEKKVLSIKCVV
jgi:hypothetical protein